MTIGVFISVNSVRTLHSSLLPSPSVRYPLHVAKVDKTDRIVVANEYVPRVRIGVEGAVDKELPGVHLEYEGDDPVGVQGKS